MDEAQLPEEEVQVPAREHHHVEVDRASIKEGENTFICTLCQQSIVLVWDGQAFSLREEEANNPDFGTVGIAYTGQ